MINYSKIKVKSDAVFIMNILNYNKIPLRKISIEDKYTVFYIKAKHLDEVVKLFTNHGKVFEVLQDNSIKRNFKKNVFRFGIYAGLFFVLFFMFFYANTLTRVEISGNKLVSDEMIYDVVDNFVKIPSFNKNIDCKTLIKKLIALENISSASAERKGNTLIIKVYEELPKVEIENKTQFKDVVSKYDSIVTRIVTFSGSSRVKRGDTVRKGDIVFSTDIDLGDGLTTKEYANGIAYGRVWFSKELIIEPFYMVNERTDRKIERIKFFVNDVYIPEFKQYEIEKSEIFLSNILPLKYTKYTYYETESVIRETDFFKNEQGYVEQYGNSLREQLPEECTILRNWHDVKVLDKNIKLVIYYEVEIKIT